MDEMTARAAASASPLLRPGIVLGDVQELREGWYFPFLSKEMAGSNGVIVNKKTGRLFHLGSPFPPARDLELYDRGYQFDCYDLVILSVRDRAQTLSALADLRLPVVEPKEEDGVWKIPREMTKRELSRRLDQLPSTLHAVKLYLVAEVL